MSEQPYRVGVDIGGTFTDLIVVNQATGAFAVGKLLTTPDDPSRAVEDVLAETLRQAGIAPAEVRHLVHGTTLVTNAVIERKGARTALLTTQGFRDSIEIGREQRYDLYDLMLEHPRPLAPRYLRFDVPQRTLADGTTTSKTVRSRPLRKLCAASTSVLSTKIRLNSCSSTTSGKLSVR